MTTREKRMAREKKTQRDVSPASMTCARNHDKQSLNKNTMRTASFCRGSCDDRAYLHINCTRPECDIMSQRGIVPCSRAVGDELQTIRSLDGRPQKRHFVALSVACERVAPPLASSASKSHEMRRSRTASLAKIARAVRHIVAASLLRSRCGERSCRQTDCSRPLALSKLARFVQVETAPAITTSVSDRDERGQMTASSRAALIRACGRVAQRSVAQHQR